MRTTSVSESLRRKIWRCISSGRTKYTTCFGKFPSLVRPGQREPGLLFLLTNDAELRHLGLERGPFHAERGGSPGGSADDPLGRLEGPHNVVALGVFQRGDRVRQVHGGRFQLHERDTELGPGRENYGPLNQILEL